PNFYAETHLAFVPNDTNIADQWHLNNTGQSAGTVDADIDGYEAWDITKGSPDVVIAVLNTGTQIDHPDLAANIFVNSGEIAGNHIDDDGNGWIDDVHGWNFVDDNNDPSPGTDPLGDHATAVAGLAAAVGNNSLGVAGVAYQSRILPVRMINASDSSIAE